MTGNNGFLPEEEQGRIMRGVCMFCTTFVLVLLLILGLSGCFTSTGCPSTTETSPSSSAGNLTMPIDEFASKDDLWIKDLISGPVDPDLEIKIAEIQNWIRKSSQKFDANSYFSKATRYVLAHGDDAGWTFDESISKESVDEMIKKINEEQGAITSVEALNFETYMEKMQEVYVKRVIEFFQLRPEDLDSTPEYFCEVFGFCEFLEKPTISDTTPESKITAGEAEIGRF